MLKIFYFRLGLVSAITLISILVVLPRTPVVIKNKYISIDSYIGGYYLNLFGGKLTFDFRQVKRGLDLEGGIKIVLKADMSKIEESQKKAALESAKNIISKRIDLLGVSEPSITTSNVAGDYRIIVEIPGIDDVTSAIKLIGQTAQLKFRVLKKGEVWDESKIQEFAYNPDVWEDTNVTGSDLKGVDVVFSSSRVVDSDRPEIKLLFTTEGRRKFSEVAKKNVNKPVSLFLDQDIVSMPVVNEDLAKGLTEDPVISGNFDVKTANALSMQIRAGALPIPVEILEQKTVSATLGADSVHRSIFAGLVGLILVLIFMVYSYGRFGVMADIALIIYGLIVFLIFKLISVTLTLPGIAGFILSVGMAADANILIFERIKEEYLWGKPMGLAVRLGFERAWNSIKDSNISSIITSLVLFYFGTGFVRGFALTLFIGIVVSLFTSIFVTRTLVNLFYENPKGAKHAN